ncbi:hypothetical protein D3C83_152260 [compost metagenome]
MQRWIQGTGLDLQQVVGLRPDCLSNAVSMLRAPLQGPKNQHVEGSLEEVQAAVIG